MPDGPRKAESAVQILIMLTIGGAAGAASFTHVHNVAAAHGQPGWLAWADAIVLELMSIASGLELRRRIRAQASVRFPAAVLGCAVVLSLTAQVVEAEPSPIGWTAAAVPALGFLVMVKIALGYTGPATHGRGGPVALDHTESAVDLSPHGPEAAAPRSAHRTGRPSTVTRSGRADRGPSADQLLPAAQQVRDDLAARGRPLTRETLAEALRGTGHTVSNVRASELVKTLRAQPPPPAGLDRPPVSVPQLTATTAHDRRGQPATETPIQQRNRRIARTTNPRSTNRRTQIMSTPLTFTDHVRRADASTPSAREVWTVDRLRALGVTTTLTTAASILGISRSQPYRLAATDTFPVPLIRAGTRIIVPTAGLLRLLLPDDTTQPPGQRRLDPSRKPSVDATTTPPADYTHHRWRPHAEHPGDDE